MEIEPSERYWRLKEELIVSGKLYEDPEFPAEGKSIGGPIGKDPKIQWLRPPEITDNPQFIIQGMTRQDIFQGRIRDCFLLAGAACISVTSPDLLYRVVPPGQNFDMQYTGMFRFYFWRYGEWVEVLIDDRLPTIKGKLFLARNRNKDGKNEFWVSLMEKAYAKMNGSYMNIDTGFIHEALVDLTGGIGEIIRVEEYADKPKTLFKLMSRTMEMSSFMGCAVNIQAGNIEEEVGNGLYAGHAYSVTKLTTIAYKDKMLPLIRLRNPWGRREWDGDWGDKSKKWKRISETTKVKLEYDKKEDGEFWMSFDDWVDNFKGLYICHLTPESYFGLLLQGLIVSQWHSQVFHGEWVLNTSAGGCGNPPYRELFWTNPQYVLNVESAGNPDEKITLVISVTQKYRTDETNDYINFLTFRLKPGVDSNRDTNFTEDELTPIRRRRDFVNVRDVSGQLRVRPGLYVVVPCTFRPNKPGHFMLRVFSEIKTPVRPKSVQKQPLM